MKQDAAPGIAVELRLLGFRPTGALESWRRVTTTEKSMAKGKNKKVKKDKRWSELDDEFMQAVASTKDEAELNVRIAGIAKNMAAMDDAKKADLDLASIREQLKTANEPYAIAKKADKQRICFIREQLRSMGKDAGSFSEEDVLLENAQAAV